MEHESFVPTPAPLLAQALRTPGAVARSLPGWQPDPSPPAGAEGPGQSGRLRLRVAGSTITYRGTVTVRGTASPFTLEAHGTEVRGSGTVRLTAQITVAPTEHPDPGTTLTWHGRAQADGRLASYEPAVVEAAVRRLLDRFAAELAAHAPEEPPSPEPSGLNEPQAPVAPPSEREPADREPEEPDEPEEPEEDVVDDLGEPLPPAGLDDFELVEVEVEVPESAAALDDLVPPAEAAHARRTMIGRSAEEVDHAPPRGRYAPVPAPDASSAAATLRWAAPAAAALLASAVVVGRVLRRRK
ncbi:MULTISPECIES: CoxG family protein [unclassified Streptomyces]|uniref:CoxG family protein n=1 Tax=unclassified Streptomyces TaxID=2593676 RepID=UPI002E29F176|nr:SRPBCC family protein [Streptomyces sp. NBC_00223]